MASSTAASYLSWLPDLVTGWLFFAAAGWAYRSSRSAAGYAVLIGSLWFLGSALPVASLWHRGAIAHLILLWPMFRPRGALPAATVAIGYALNLVPFVGGRPEVAIAFGAALIVAGAIRTMRGGNGALPLVAAIAFGAGLTGGLALQSTIPGSVGVYAGLLAYELGVAVVAVTLATAAMGRRNRDVADLVIELGARPAAAGRRTAALRRAMADRDDPRLAAALATADRLTTANAELEQAARARLRALTASRDRLAASEVEERVRIRRILSEELAPLYDEVTDALADLPQSSKADRIRDRVAESLAEIDALWAGLDAPDAAFVGFDVNELASRSPIPVSVSGLPHRLPRVLAESVRSICSEAILNAVKHSGASSIEVRGMRRSGRWIIVIADNGRGGATLDGGGGLLGISERARDAGAGIELDSPIGAGTRVSILLPRLNRRGGLHLR